MKVIELHVLYYYAYKIPQALNFNRTYVGGSVVPSCADTLALGLVLASDTLDKFPRSAKLNTT